jgi:two-component system, chemotaxis family, sensor kinase CheA
MTDKFERFKKMFLDECHEHVRTLERTLTSMQRGARSQLLVDDAFRAIHSIKGGAGMFGFDRIVPFAHVFETALDGVRLGEITVTEDGMSVALRATDCLADLVDACGSGSTLADGFEDHSIKALAKLAGNSEEITKAKSVVVEKSATEEPFSNELIRFAISFRPHAGLLRRANEPLLIIRHLRELGSLAVTADLSALPPLAEMQPTDSYIGWQFVLETTGGEALIRSVFEFVDGDCDLSIQRMTPEVTTPAEVTHEAFAPVFVPHEFESSDVGVTSIRVDVERIDRLVNLAGEIAISQALVAQQIDQSLFNANPRLFQELSQLLTHTQNLQDSVMAIRAQPISTIYDRMPRLVRELCELTNKKIILRCTGASTEIDKTVIEQLSDPIMHMIRNAADHGIETAEERQNSGKPPDGIITLSAEQRGSRIVIEISDDGRGIDRERVRQKAIAKNMLAPDAVLSPEDIDNLVFLPGFSTAESVTNISGRGVGMDVVKRNIQKLGGRVGLRSEPGKGSTVVLTLPLTLAVLEGMIVRSGDESYVIPLSNIVECRTSWRNDVSAIPGSGQVLKSRYGYVSLIHLHEVFKSVARRNADQSVAVIAEIEGGRHVAIVIDEIIGQQQVVIKSITENIAAVAGIAGATILGDGRVALIIDATEIAKLDASHEKKNSLNSFADIQQRKYVA